jgi:hypothetical protein
LLPTCSPGEHFYGWITSINHLELVFLDIKNVSHYLF